MGDARWLVEYGDLAIECGDEADAKKLVAALHNNGRRVTARSFGTSPPKSIENVDQIKTWLAE
jgi:FAD/FMN-containing dehydrogenase